MFVADFIGETNLLEVSVDKIDRRACGLPPWEAGMS